MWDSEHVLMRRRSIHTAVCALIVFAACQVSQSEARAEVEAKESESMRATWERPRSESLSPDDYPIRAVYQIGAASVAREVCAAVFIQNREPKRFLERSSKFWLPPEVKDGIEVFVDRNAREVTLTLTNGVSATGIFTGASGCTVLGPTGKRPQHKFIPLDGDIVDMSMEWPIGDADFSTGLDDSIDAPALARAVEHAFAEDAFTLAFLVIHKGKIIAERYAPGIDKDTPMQGWSMAKTLQATILGRMEQKGLVGLYERVDLPEWSKPGDLRADTTLADLMRMSALMSCGNGDPQFDFEAWRRDGYPYYLYTFSGPEDAYRYSVSRPPLNMPGREEEPRGYYTNCQPHVLGSAMKYLLAKEHDTITNWATQNLFEPLGMRSVIMEKDRKGNPLTAGHILATTRDWGRLGLLYALDGVWQGQRLLSKDFMSFVRAPAPHWEQPIYGGQVWFRDDDCAYWACDTYQMNGIEGQRVMIVPSRDLVVVRLGEGAGDIPSSKPDRVRPALIALDKAGAELMQAIPSNRPANAASVESGLRAFFDSLGAGDHEDFTASISDDFTLYEDGRVWDGDKIFNVVTAPPLWIRRWTLSQQNTKIHGDSATIVYRNTLRATHGDEVRVKEWLESAHLVREGQRWIVDFIHSTEISQIED